MSDRAEPLLLETGSGDLQLQVLGDGRVEFLADGHHVLSVEQADELHDWLGFSLPRRGPLDRTVRIKLPAGYASAAEFAADCGFELAGA